ncbi:MAG: hypothetical protein ACXW32_04190 [Limisphaerales bacterium]
MDRSRGSIFASPVVLFAAASAVTMIAGASHILPGFWKLTALLFAAVPFI